MPKLSVDFNGTCGKVRPLHSVGQPPILGMKGQFIHYLTEANIPYSRLHDVGGMFGGGVFVDIPNIFKDFDADPQNPKSYDFSFTDRIIQQLIQGNVKPYFRLGVTIENYTYIKRYHTFPPADYDKWAKVCEMIVRHYNEGWANGFEFGIEYWEIWNEPDSDIYNLDNNAMWHGKPETYYKLYETASKHLKNCFGEKIKVGGYGSCGFYHILSCPENFGLTGENREVSDYVTDRYRGFVEFFHGFLQHIKKTDSPMDFFSWHSYGNVEDTVLQAKYCEKILDEYGYKDAEIHINEWNNAADISKRGTSFASANAAAMMMAIHNRSRTEIMCYYDARMGPSVYGGLFNPMTHKPVCTYYSFVAFGELYKLGNCAKCECDGVYTMAASDSDKKAILLANISEDTEIVTTLGSNFKVYLVDEKNFLTQIDFDGKKISLKKNQVVLIKNY